MKLLFVHSHPFYRDDVTGEIYTGGSFPISIWEKYLLNFKEITMFGRLSKSEKSKVSITSGNPNVSFKLTENQLLDPNLYKTVSSITKELKPLVAASDVVLARLPSILGYLAVIEGVRQKKPIWVEQVGNVKESLLNHGSIKGKVASLPLHLLNKQLIKKADFISYVTINKLQQDYPASTKALTVSLSDVVIKEIISTENIDMDRFYNRKFKIGIIGGFNARYKGQDILLRAISTLPKDVVSNIEIYFAGQGTFEWVISHAMQLNLDKNIKFIGSLQPGSEINNFLSSLSLYAQPSLTEGMPRATLEAMAMGCPVISSNAGGLPDIVNKDFMHSKGDVEKLSSDIFKLYQNRDLLFHESIRSLKVSEDFHISKLTNKRLEFYNNMNFRLLKQFDLKKT